MWYMALANAVPVSIDPIRLSPIVMETIWNTKQNFHQTIPNNIFFIYLGSWRDAVPLGLVGEVCGGDGGDVCAVRGAHAHDLEDVAVLVDVDGDVEAVGGGEGGPVAGFPVS